MEAMTSEKACSKACLLQEVKAALKKKLTFGNTLCFMRNKSLTGPFQLAKHVILRFNNLTTQPMRNHNNMANMRITTIAACIAKD